MVKFLIIVVLLIVELIEEKVVKGVFWKEG